VIGRLIGIADLAVVPLAASCRKMRLILAILLEKSGLNSDISDGA